MSVPLAPPSSKYMGIAEPGFRGARPGCGTSGDRKPLNVYISRGVTPVPVT